MQENQLKTRLGKRLKALYQNIPSDTDNFLDLCCDHGALGRAILESQPNCYVTFNDINPGIMQKLSDLLKRLDARNYTLHTAPAQNAPLPETGKTTVMLAGVGNEQTVAILEHLLTQKTEHPVQFIVSPATKTHHVRRFLSEAPVSLVADQLVCENRRCYEVIVVLKDQSHQKKPVSEFGNAWEIGNQDHQRHLLKLISFYDSQQKTNRNEETTRIVESYKKILKNISDSY